MMPLTNSTKSILAVSLGSILLGSIGILVRHAGQEITPMAQTFGRMASAFFFISCFNLLTNRKSLKKPTNLFLFILDGLVGYSLMAAAFTLAAINTSLAVTYFLLYTAPLFVVGYNTIIKKEKPTNLVIISLILSLAGITLIFNPNQLGSNMIGNLFGLITGICFAAYFIITGKLRQKHTAPTVTFWTQAFGTLGLIPLVFIFDSPLEFSASPQAWTMVIIAGFIVFLGYLLLNFGLKNISTNTGSLLSLFEPLTATFLGLVLLQESLSTITLVGISLILISLILASKSSSS